MYSLKKGLLRALHHMKLKGPLTYHVPLCPGGRSTRERFSEGSIGSRRRKHKQRIEKRNVHDTVQWPDIRKIWEIL